MSQKPGPYSEEDKLNWDVEKLKAECRNLGRSFWAAVILSIVAVLGTAGNVYFNHNESVLSEIKKDRLENEAKELEVQNKHLKEEQDSLQAQRASIQQELLSLAPTLDAVKSKQVKALAGELATASVPATNATTDLPARVYLQYLRTQESKAAPVIAELRKRGYVVVAGSVGSSERKEIFVGYYYESDKAEARGLLATIRELSSAPSIAEPTLTKGGARSRHYDVWLAFPET
jgi:hypothetical protein